MGTKQTKYSIALVDGRFFDFENPQSHTFDIESIAHALSNLCRYTGHTNRFYSVAEHCVIVSKLVPEEMALEGLLHDASEAFCGDLSSPLKALLPEYKRIELTIEEAICNQFGLRFPFPPEIKNADDVAYQTEKLQVASPVKDRFWKKAQAREDIIISCWSPTMAKRQFLKRFQELNNNDRVESSSRQAA